MRRGDFAGFEVFTHVAFASVARGGQGRGKVGTRDMGGKAARVAKG